MMEQTGEGAFGVGSPLGEPYGSPQSARLASAGPLYCSALSARKRAEQDSILLANRIRLLKAEEERTRKNIRDTERKTKDILDARRRNEDQRIAREAQQRARQDAEEEARLRSQVQRRDQQQKLVEKQRSLLQQRAVASQSVRQEREASSVLLQQRRRLDEAEALHKKERVRESELGAARSRARSEGAKQDNADRIYRERLSREEAACRDRERTILRMEQEEAELIARLQHTQERHKVAFKQLEDAMRQGAAASSLSGSRLPSPRGSTVLSTPRGSASEESAPARAPAGPRPPPASGMVHHRPPLPRGAVAQAGALAGSPGAHSTPRVGAPPRRQSVGAVGALRPLKGSKAMCSSSSCSTASGDMGADAASGPPTPNSASQKILYTTVDGQQLDIPAEDDLDLAALLNS